MTRRWILGLGEVKGRIGQQGNNLRFGVRLGTLLLLARNLSPDHVFPNIILLREGEELADLGGTLGTQSLGNDNIGQSRNLGFSLLDDDEREDGDIVADDATANRLALALTSAAGAVA